MVEFKLSVNKLLAFSSTGSPCRDKHCEEINTHSNLPAFNDLDQARFQVPTPMGNTCHRCNSVKSSGHSFTAQSCCPLHASPIYTAFPLHAAFPNPPEWTTPESANSFYTVLKRGRKGKETGVRIPTIWVYFLETGQPKQRDKQTCAK